MTVKNTWHDKQKRNEKNLFAPKWDQKTITWMIGEIEQMTDVAEIQLTLIKDYKISLVTAYSWVEMARRIMKDLNNGLSLEDAIERDRVRRDVYRRKTT